MAKNMLGKLAQWTLAIALGVAGTEAWHYTHPSGTRPIVVKNIVQTNITNNVTYTNETVITTNEVIRAEPLKDLPSPGIEDSEICVYISNVKGSDYKMPIHASEYIKYKQRSHRISNKQQYVNFLTPSDKSIIEETEYLTKGCNTLEEKAHVITEFLQAQRYFPDPWTNEDYVKYPLETLVEGGDCEDLAILGASMMQSAGLEVALIHHPPVQGDPTAHMSLGVCGNFDGSYYDYNGKKYYNVESGSEWLNRRNNVQIGYIMDKYRTRGADLLVPEYQPKQIAKIEAPENKRVIETPENQRINDEIHRAREEARRAIEEVNKVLQGLQIEIRIN